MWLIFSIRWWRNDDGFRLVAFASGRRWWRGDDGFWLVAFARGEGWWRGDDGFRLGAFASGRRWWRNDDGFCLVAFASGEGWRRSGSFGLETKLIKPDKVDSVAKFLTLNMGLFFVPAGVGLITQVDLIKQYWAAIVISMIVSTALVLVVVGRMQHRFERHHKEQKTNNNA